MSIAWAWAGHKLAFRIHRRGYIEAYIKHPSFNLISGRPITCADIDDKLMYNSTLHATPSYPLRQIICYLR